MIAAPLDDFEVDEHEAEDVESESDEEDHHTSAVWDSTKVGDYGEPVLKKR